MYGKCKIIQHHLFWHVDWNQQRIYRQKHELKRSAKYHLFTKYIGKQWNDLQGVQQLKTAALLWYVKPQNMKYRHNKIFMFTA